MQKVAKQMLVVILFLSQEANKNTLKLHSSQLPHHRHKPVQTLSLCLSLSVFKPLSMYLVF